jgi:Uma2 family endonuclease
MSVALMIPTWITKARKDEFAEEGSKPIIIYPESDGQPMAESDIHRDYMVDVIDTLKDRYRNQNDVYVSGNLFIYYEKGVKSSVFSPDAFVIFGVAKKRRRSYKLWEEGNKVPDVVFEVTSLSTWLELEDEGNKKTLCRRLGVPEYFMYDPKGEYLNPPLQGSRLERGVYLDYARCPRQTV